MRAGVATAEVGVLHDHDGPSILLRPLRAGSRKALGHDRRRVSFRVITSGVSLTLCLADGPERRILARTEFLRSTGPQKAVDFKTTAIRHPFASKYRQNSRGSLFIGTQIGHVSPDVSPSPSTPQSSCI